MKYVIFVMVFQMFAEKSEVVLGSKEYWIYFTAAFLIGLAFDSLKYFIGKARG